MTKKDTSPFSMEALKQVQDFAPIVRAKECLEVSVRRPAKSVWFMTHPECHTDAVLLELDDDADMDHSTYFVPVPLAMELRDDPRVGDLIRPASLYFYCTKSGNFFFWRVWISDSDNRWLQSAHEYAQDFGRWQRISANKQQGEYQQIVTEASWPSPQWPDASLSELLEIAFRGKLIADSDHEVIKTLKGEA